jgi:hypothetical protein
MVPESLVTTVLYSVTLPFADAAMSVCGDMNAFSDLDRNTGLPNLPCLDMWAVPTASPFCPQNSSNAVRK